MPVQIETDNATLHIKVVHPRIDGENFILKALRDGNYFEQDFETVNVDLNDVEYLNSLGITEFVNIHRGFLENTEGKTKLRLLNVEKKVNAILELVELQKIADIHLKEE